MEKHERVQADEGLWDVDDVLRHFKLRSRTTVNKYIKLGVIPPPVWLSARCRRWKPITGSGKAEAAEGVAP